MTFRFHVGQAVEAKQSDALGWQPARIDRLEPYLGRPGYYVRYTNAREQWECHGGWKPEQLLRGVVPAGVKELT